MVTVAGRKKMIGEVEINLKGLMEIDRKRVIHVASIPGRSHDMIMGTDLLGPGECYVRFKHKNWRVKLGQKSYRVRETEKLDEPIEINIVNVNEESGKFRKLFEKLTYKEGEILEATKRIKHRIDLIDDRPTYSKPRRYPVAFREIIREHIKEMLDTEVLRESVSTFNSPLWVVPKKLDKSGVQKYRVVVDYRELKKRTKTEKYPLPRLEEMIDRMSRSEIFSVIYLKSGYHQIPMETRDIEKTSFQFERGHYEYNRMPFGLRNAPATFQRLMDAVLKPLGMGFVQGYIDDLIIFSKSKTEHLRHLRVVFLRLREAGLTASASKSKFALESIHFLGYVISREGVAPARKKVQGILDAGVPQNQTEIRMINYYRRFTPNATEVCKPLTAALQKGGNVKDVKGFKEALEQVTDILCRLPTLRYPRFQSPLCGVYRRE
ncbi:hypothetical protein AAG570_011040 [Ranatra chinensis]|uniref:Reverse transcriptase domain-containing protein n=1 Tax=Ranatra chinensis TaxID=642074 RepID=A0ABD0Z5R7_9HEMI